MHVELWRLSRYCHAIIQLPKNLLGTHVYQDNGLKLSKEFIQFLWSL